MLRSMFAGVSGVRSHQTMMDVVGNNIANVNTTGFKSSRVTFQDTLSQLQRGANGAGGAPGLETGGVNSQQIGLGVKVGSIDNNMNQGPLQATGRATDLAVQGEGYFVLDSGDDRVYSRAGAFDLDNTGFLRDPAGYIVQGYMADADGTITVPADGEPENIVIGEALASDPTVLLQSISIGNDGTISGVFSDGESRALGRVALATFTNPGGLQKQGNNHLRADANSGPAVIGAADEGDRGSLAAGALEMSNVDLAQEFTSLIIAQRGFQANSRVISASDELLQDLVNLKR